MKLTHSIGALALVLAAPMAANASLLSFDAVTGSPEATPVGQASNCGGADYCYNPLVFQIDGITVKVYGSSSPYTPIYDQVAWYDISPASLGGIGVATPEEVAAGDNSADSAYGWTERLWIEFSAPVTLGGFWMNGDHVAFDDSKGGYVQNGDYGYLFGADAVNGFVDLSSYSDQSYGTLFSIGADFYETYWYLAGVSFDAADVPEPASLALLGLGLTGIGFARRRRRAA